MALGAGEWIATALTVLANEVGSLVPASKSAIDQMVASVLALLGDHPRAPGPGLGGAVQGPGARAAGLGGRGRRDATPR